MQALNKLSLDKDLICIFAVTTEFINGNITRVAPIFALAVIVNEVKKRMVNNQQIRLENFSEADFDALLSWIKEERELIQFAGPIFSFPLTKVQLCDYITDSKRHAFKIIHNDTNMTIGHCEAYKTDEQNSRLCRIIIGNKKFRGKGYGTILTKLLTEWSFDNLHTNFVDLNVYDFNISAIKSYENVGFKITAINEAVTQVNDENWTSYKMTVTREEFYKKTRLNKIKY